MQFVEKTRYFQVKAYRGYDAVKKQPKISQIGKIGRWDLRWEPSETFPPTEDEVKEVEAWIADRTKKDQESREKYSLVGIHITVAKASDLVEKRPELVDDIDLQALVAALDDLQAKLKPKLKAKLKAAAKAAATPKPKKKKVRKAVKPGKKPAAGAKKRKR